MILAWLALLLAGGIVVGWVTKERLLPFTLLGVFMVAVAGVQIGKWIMTNPP